MSLVFWIVGIGYIALSVFAGLGRLGLLRRMFLREGFLAGTERAERRPESAKEFKPTGFAKQLFDLQGRVAKAMLLLSPRLRLPFISRRVFWSKFVEPATPYLIPFSEELVTSYRDRICRYDRIVLSGVSGAGKSTFVYEMCREMDRERGKRIPVQITASEFRKEHGDILKAITCAVGESLSTRLEWYRRLATRRLLSSGRFLLIIDDLDYVRATDLQKVKEFSDEWKSNAYIFVISSPPTGATSLNLFATIPSLTVLPWTEEQGSEYLNRRLGREESQTLYRQLASHSLVRAQTALQWKCYADAYLNNSIFELLPFKTAAGTFGIIEGYIQLQLKKASESAEKVPEIEMKLGRLALRMIKEDRSVFDPEESQLRAQELGSLRAIIFKNDSGRFRFAHSSHQVALAGKYVAYNWPTARKELTSDAGSLISSSIFDVAKHYISPTELDSLRDVFRSLASSARNPGKA